MAIASIHTGTHFAASRPGQLARLEETIRIWRARARRRAQERVELTQWLDRDLHDAGISRADVVFEVNKPFWRG